MKLLDRYRNHRARRRQADEARILTALAYDGELSVYPLSRYTGIRSAKLWTILADLESQGRVASRWAHMAPPRRRLYSLTAPPHPDDCSCWPCTNGR